MLLLVPFLSAALNGRWSVDGAIYEKGGEDSFSGNDYENCKS